MRKIAHRNSSLFVFTYGLYNNIITYRQHIVNTQNYPMGRCKKKAPSVLLGAMV